MAHGITVSLNPGGRPGRGIRRSMPTQNVTITGNFLEGPCLLIDASQTRGLTIKNNIFNQPFADENWHGFGLIDDNFGDPLRAPIRLAAIKDAVVSDNIVYDPQNRAQGRLVTLGPLTTNIVVNGKAQWDTIADLLSSWYPEAQSGRGWSFGTLDAALVQAGAYSFSDFKPLPVFDGGSWKPAAGSNPYPVISKTGERPSAMQAAARRWISTIEGEARVDISTQTPGNGNGTIVSVFVEGACQSRQDNADHQPHQFSVPLHNLKIGSAVDFVLDAKSDVNADYTLFYAKILTPPPGSGRRRKQPSKSALQKNRRSFDRPAHKTAVNEASGD